MAKKPVDTAIVMVVGPCIDDSDFKSLEESIEYDAAGMDISLIVEKADNTSAVTAITLTSGGANDWTHKDGGYYEVEITDAQNAEEGIAFVRGICTGVLPFESPRYEIVPANIYDSLIKGTDYLKVDALQISGEVLQIGGSSGYPVVDAQAISDSTGAANNVEANIGNLDSSISGLNNISTGDVSGEVGKALDSYDPPTNAEMEARTIPFADYFDPDNDTVAHVTLVDTTTTNTDVTALDTMLDAKIEDILANLETGGSVFYVSTTGDNTDGLSWATAKTSLDAAIALCIANKGDKIFIAPGTYDETVNGASGVICDIAGIYIIGIATGVTIQNTDTTNSGKVFTITANNVWLNNFLVDKGEVTSDNSIMIDVSGSYVSADARDVTIAVEKANHTGIKVSGGAVGCGFVGGAKKLSYIYSTNKVGIGIEVVDANHCAILNANIHDVDTALLLSGGASCDSNFLGGDVVISNCDIGVQLNSGAVNNVLNANILNCTTSYVNNSGNETNNRNGSLTWVLSDIRAAIVESSPQNHTANSSNDTTGTIVSGTYENTETDDGVYWQIAPVTPAVGGFGLNVDLVMSIGTGRVPVAVDINGYFSAASPAGTRAVEVWAYNYTTSVWVQLSSGATNMGNETSDQDYQYILSANHVKIADGEVKIRFTSTSINTSDDLYLDRVLVSSVTSGAAGLTPEGIAIGVWANIDGHEVSRHLLKFVGYQYYVDGTNGNDANSGDLVHDAKATIGAAITEATNGDRIIVKAGTYDEDGLDLSSDGMELWFEHGAVLINTTPGTVLTVSSNYCRLNLVELKPNASQIGYHVTGNGCLIEDCTAHGAGATQFDIDGDHTKLLRCRAGQYSVCGFNLSNTKNYLRDCFAKGSGGATRGYYLSHTDAEYNWLDNCCSINNDTAGYETVSGADHNVFSRCVSAGDTNAKVDNGSNNSWVALRDVEYQEVNTIQIEGLDATNVISGEIDAGLARYDGPTNAEMEERTIPSADYFDPSSDTVVDVTTVGSVSGNVDGSIGSLAAQAKTDMSGELSSALSNVNTAVDDMTEDDSGVLRFTANALEEAPTGGGAAPTVSEIRTEMDDNSTKLISINDKTTNLPSDPADQSKVELAISTSEGNIRGADSDTLETLSDQIDVVQTDLDNPDQYKADVSGVATASVCTEARLAELDAGNLPADIDGMKAKTDNLPSGIAKNTALSNFNVYMVLTSDHVTAATGKTITGTISKDSGAFVALSNAVSEIGAGIYKVDLTQAEMNADTVTLKFSETTCDQRIVVIYPT